ncbi:MAG: hypothetical protein ABIT08_03370 [Bacteroidia bacterium]
MADFYSFGQFFFSFMEKIYTVMDATIKINPLTIFVILPAKAINIPALKSTLPAKTFNTIAT